jgi:hypothetical protein
METPRAQAAYDLARAEEDVADQAFLEAETLLKRRRAELTAKRKVTDIMRRRLEDAQRVRIPLILQEAQGYICHPPPHPPPPRVAEQRLGGSSRTEAGRE